MRLKKIQVSGFKSFVDTTTLKMSADIIGVVGPNGCGKSNVIDAIRWVMGEMSAKNLRGSNMADVIFNGSVNRKPVGKASVELVFDNSDQSVEGPYGVFSEISVKRTLSRDGGSEYFVNNTAARRRDITDIFLGTGLGPRSYSIIEQGMVSRIIEARPDELRSFVEEASGVSKYKERRRETETRMRQTRDNLDRVDDIRRELDAQLRRLERQSQAAQRYREYRAEERQVRSELMSIRWQALTDSLDRFNDEAETISKDLESKSDEITAAQERSVELRVEQSECQESVNQAQAKFYQIGSEISNVESRIEHARETLESNRNEQTRLNTTVSETRAQLEQDRTELNLILSKTSALRPEVERGQELADGQTRETEEAETQWGSWQREWELFNEQAAAPDRASEVQQTRIDEISRHVQKLMERRDRLDDERNRIDTDRRQVSIGFLRDEVATGLKEWEDAESRLLAIDTNTADVRTTVRDLGERLQSERVALSENVARLQSLEEVQQALRGDNNAELTAELESRGLAHAPRLGDVLDVEFGWERAVDAVLGRLEAAIVVDSIESQMRPGETTSVWDEHASSSASTGESGLAGSGVALIERGQTDPRTPFHSLAARCRSSQIDTAELFAGVYAAPTMSEALAIRERLLTGQCVVTRDGVILERTYVRLGRDGDAAGGMLEREHEMETLRQTIAKAETEVSLKAAALERAESQLSSLDIDRAATSRSIAELSRMNAEREGQLGRQETRDSELENRFKEIATEIEDIDRQIADDQAQMTTARHAFSEANQQKSDSDARKVAMLAARETLVAALAAAREKTASALDAKHRLELDYGRMLASRESIEGGITRLEDSLGSMTERLTELDEAVATAEDPDSRFGPELERLALARTEAEEQLKSLREKSAEIDETLAQNEQRRQVLDREAGVLREKLQNRQVARQEIVVRRQTVQEQIEGLGTDPETVLANLPEEADEDTWEDRLDTLSRKIDRIGPVNLVAIEEFEEQTERKELLDTQSEDLYKALEMLEGVMDKIDQETRQRFMDTFDALNANFKDFFPKLFGGGSAELRLTDDDVLTAGVSVMAQPPGKRNTTIALLSGGEKAMTAVSLLFSLFRLNPAPFCLLDEVDAPLDDANVERYCTLLKGLADHTQLIFITHNKITMEIADALLGVTMGEPGVSRLVSVDVDEAMALAAQ